MNRSERASLRWTEPLDLMLTLGPLKRGPHDPTMHLWPDGMRRATRTPQGPATLEVGFDGSFVRASAWGPGRTWALEALPALIGRDDDPSEFRPREPRLAAMARRFAGMRIARTGAVTEALVPAILEQKVTSVEAYRAYAAIVRTFGEPAPGPFGLFVPPAPEVLAGVPYWGFHRFGVERRRAETLRRVCGVSRRLDETAAMPVADAYARLVSLPGVGLWTAAEVGGRAYGDPDAVPVGDFHIPHLVAWALAGRPRGDDRLMLELLEPYAGQRGRVIRLLEAAGIAAPKFGPRKPRRSIARI